MLDFGVETSIDRESIITLSIALALVGAFIILLIKIAK